MGRKRKNVLKFFAVTMGVLVLITSMVLASCTSNQTTNTTTTTQVTSTSQPTTSTTSTQPTTTSVTTSAVSTPTTKTNAPEYGGTITLGMAGDPRRWDPIIHEGGSEVIQRYVYESLVNGNWAAPDLAEKPNMFKVGTVDYSDAAGCIAESWEIPDSTTMIWHIRHGVYFQSKPPVNGRELTSADIVYCFNRMLGFGEFQGKPSPTVSGLPLILIKSVTAQDKYTVVMKHDPSAAFVDYIMANDVSELFYAKESVQAQGGMDDWHNAVGTGPWMIDTFVPGQYIQYIKNPTYWGHDERNPENQLPYANICRYLVIPDVTTQIAAFRTGKIDVISSLTYDTLQSIQKTNPNVKSYKTPGYAVSYLLKVNKAPFSDIRVRQALQMALNLPEIAATYYKGQAIPHPSGVVSEAMTAYAPPFEDWPQTLKDTYSYNPTKAKELLAAAGVPNLIFEIAVTGTNDIDLVQIYKGYYQAIGVTMNINIMDSGTINSVIWSHTFKDSIYIYYGGMFYAPLASFGFYKTGVSWNFADFSDPVFDKYYNDIQNSPDIDEFYRLSKEALQYLNAKQCLICGCPVYNFGLYQQWLGGYSGESGLGMYRLGAIMARLWVNQGLK